MGTTTVTSVKDIPDGTHSMVDFDADRVLFYPQVGSKVMTAYVSVPAIELFVQDLTTYPFLKLY